MVGVAGVDNEEREVVCSRMGVMKMMGEWWWNGCPGFVQDNSLGVWGC